MRCDPTQEGAIMKRIRLGKGELTALEHIAIVTAFVLVLYGTYLGAHS